MVRLSRRIAPHRSSHLNPHQDQPIQNNPGVYMANLITSKLKDRLLYKTVFTSEDPYNQVHEEFIIWKPLTWSQYNAFRDVLETTSGKALNNVQDLIFEMCVVESSFDINRKDLELDAEMIMTDEEFLEIKQAARNTLGAGIIPTVAKLIFKHSGFSTEVQFKEARDNARGRVSNLENVIVATVCKAFPAYKPEEVYDLPWETVILRVAQAELILGSPLVTAGEVRAAEAAAESKKKKKKQNVFDEAEEIQIERQSRRPPGR